MEDVNSKLARKLRELRGNLPLTQLEKATNIPRSLLYRFEKGTRTPHNIALHKLAEFYKLNFIDLKILHFEDLYPPGSEDRESLITWFKSL